MIRHALIAFALFCLLPGLALANGYDVYAPPVAWSPDGKHLAAIVSQDWPYHSEAMQGELLLLDRYGHGEALLAGALASPCFSPDSAWLALVLDGDLVAYNLAEEALVWLTVRGDVFDCNWAPAMAGDPLYLLFSAGERFYGSEVYSMRFMPDAEGSAELLTNSGPEASCYCPSMSPDGRHFLFSHQFSYNAPADSSVYERLYWLLDGTEQPGQQLTLPQYREEDYHESNVCWQDADTILFQRGGWGDWRLIRKDLDSGVETIMFTDAQQPSLSSDGGWLAFTRRGYSAKAEMACDWEVPPSVWVTKLSRRAVRQLSSPDVQAAHPAVSPDGTRIAWLEYDGDVVSVYVTRLSST